MYPYCVKRIIIIIIIIMLLIFFHELKIPFHWVLVHVLRKLRMRI